ncbi:thioesterase II family protein [Actinophytocola sediminis]
MTGYLDRPPAGGVPRLFCFHHAGGGASAFAGWRAALAGRLDVYPVQLPGREGRASEPPVRDLDTLIADLDVHIGQYLGGRFLLYGHSMGALIAYRLTRHLVATGRSTPEALVVGGYPPPDDGSPVATGDPQLAVLLDEVGDRLGRFPRWATAARALLEHDIALVDSHRPAATAPLPVPIHVLAGATDPLMSPSTALGWAAYTRAGCRVHIVPGGHFFTRDSPARVHALVAAAATTYSTG